jgi:glucan phosphorylase
MLRALGHHKIARFHMNEGHASLLTVALLDEQARLAGCTIFRNDIRIAYVENYDMELGRLFTAGVDIWLNTPATTGGSLWHQRDEGRNQWRSQP